MTRADALAEASAVHCFELAGLGKAPFRVAGYERKVGPITLHDGLMVGAPGQPMGTCDYCSQGIADCYVIGSADGRRFIVGSDCVMRTGDAGLRKVVEGQVAKLRRERDRVRRASRDAAVRDELAALLADEAVRARLAAQPHPLDWAAAQGQTMLDNVEWMRLRAVSGCSSRSAPSWPHENAQPGDDFLCDAHFARREAVDVS